MERRSWRSTVCADRAGKQVRLGDALKALVSRSDANGTGLAQARIESVWEEVVGPEVSRHTARLALREDELTVHVDSHTWASELSLMGEHLRERVNSALGESLVGSVRFTVSKAVAERESRRRSERAVKRGYGGDPVTPEPLGPEEREWVERSADAIPSDSLREAAIRATVRDLEWKKARAKRKDSQEGSGGPTRTNSSGLP